MLKPKKDEKDAIREALAKFGLPTGSKVRIPDALVAPLLELVEAYANKAAEVREQQTHIRDLRGTADLQLRRLAELTQRVDELGNLALEDELTGLPNRRALNRHLTRMPRRLNDAPCIIIADLNYLKRFNSYSEELGSTAIQLVADTLSRHFAGSGDTADRGFIVRHNEKGDEFVIVTYKTQEAELKAQLEAANEALLRQPLVDRQTGTVLPVSIAFGYCYLNQVNNDVKTAMEKADQEMNKHKRGPSKQRTAERARELEKESVTVDPVMSATPEAFSRREDARRISPRSIAPHSTHINQPQSRSRSAGGDN